MGGGRAFLARSVCFFRGFSMDLSFVSEFGAVGFSGSRLLSAESLGALRSVAGLVAPSARVFVGCAPGADQAARRLFPGAVVSRASEFGRGRGSFAARSVAVVRAVQAAGGLWLSFPSGPCPPGLLPSSSPARCFGGFGSGSWASLALAVGLGVPSLLFLPPSVPCPVGFRLVPLGGCSPSGVEGGWFRFVPRAAQLGLF